MNYNDLVTAFDALNPYDKALFIDARLCWSSNSMLLGELQLRLCHPMG